MSPQCLLQKRAGLEVLCRPAQPHGPAPFPEPALSGLLCSAVLCSSCPQMCPMPSCLHALCHAAPLALTALSCLPLPTAIWLIPWDSVQTQPSSVRPGQPVSLPYLSWQNEALIASPLVPLHILYAPLAHYDRLMPAHFS